MKIILKTERLVLREMTDEDIVPLGMILQDPEVMYAYEHAFSDEEVLAWMAKHMSNYRLYGFGLWAAELQATGNMIGQCGLTLQPWLERNVLEIGYLFQKAFWHKGYATESARACKAYAFDVLNAVEVYSIVRENNHASQRVAEKNGLRPVGSLVKHYYKTEMPHIVYGIKRPDTI